MRYNDIILVREIHMADQRSQRRGGVYFFNNTPYVSVTKAISVLDKPALRYWYGNMVYEAMVINPSLSQKEALAAPYKKSKKAMSRGTTVHSIVEAYKHTGIQINTVPDDLKGYAEAFYSFVSDYNFKQTDVVTAEKTVKSDLYRYAGTVDLIANRNNQNIVIDVKTNKDGNLYDEVELQASAYMQALNEDNQNIEKIYGLALAPTGKYTFKQLEYNLKPFLSALQLYVWKNKDFLRKTGYPVDEVINK